MRVAFLFTTTNPSIEPLFYALDQILPDELRNINSYVQQSRRNTKSLDEILIFQFNSISRDLTLKLHQKLENYALYLGFIQVNFSNTSHIRLFSIADPLVKLENGRVFFLYSSEMDESESIADESIDYLQEKHGTLNMVMKIEKRDNKFRFTAFDTYFSPELEVKIHREISHITDNWQLLTEQTIAQLYDCAPEAADELLSAISLVTSTNFSSEHCGQVGVALRRCLEKITEAYIPGDDTSPGYVVKRWKSFFKQWEKNAQNKKGETEAINPYGDYIVADIIDIESTLNRLRTTIAVDNKAVHEDWKPHIFISLTIRTITLIRDLLDTRRLIQPTRYFEPGLFEDN